MDTAFTPVASTLGGALIGASASLLLLAQGRIAGISGIVGGLFAPRAGDIAWRVAFLAGLGAAGAGAAWLAPAALEVEIDRPAGLIALAGLLVGVGTRMGNGCTVAGASTTLLFTGSMLAGMWGFAVWEAARSARQTAAETVAVRPAVQPTAQLGSEARLGRYP